MVLSTRSWGPAGAHGVVCIHGLTVQGRVFEELGARLGERDHSVAAVDLRGHGDSGRTPPWNMEAHVQDLLETVDSLGIDQVTWVGHSFGGRVAATVAAHAPDRARRLVLLDPALEVPPEGALRSAEIDRLDWSFATVDGAINALLSSESVVAAPREAVEAFARDDVRRGPDGRYRFRFCPSTAVVAWSEMSLPAPRVAQLPTLVVRPTVPFFDGMTQETRYREELGDLLTEATVPHGHNMLWESPAETIEAVERFLALTAE